MGIPLYWTQSNLEIDMLSAIRNLDYVVLLYEDMPRMRAFYHGILGFPIYRDWDGWLEMRVGAILLTLFCKSFHLLMWDDGAFTFS